MFGKSRQKREARIEYTVSSCAKCSRVQKRRFAKGDAVFAESEDACTACDGTMTVEQIFSEEAV